MLILNLTTATCLRTTELFDWNIPHVTVNWCSFLPLEEIMEGFSLVFQHGIGPELRALKN